MRQPRQKGWAQGYLPRSGSLTRCRLRWEKRSSSPTPPPSAGRPQGRADHLASRTARRGRPYHVRSVCGEEGGAPRQAGPAEASLEASGRLRKSAPGHSAAQSAAPLQPGRPPARTPAPVACWTFTHAVTGLPRARPRIFRRYLRTGARTRHRQPDVQSRSSEHSFRLLSLTFN